MDLVTFPEVNRTYAKDQPEYRPLPCLALNEPEGRIVFCWRANWHERLKILWTGELWHEVMTFNQKLQPQLVTVDNPIIRPAQTWRQRITALLPR